MPGSFIRAVFFGWITSLILLISFSFLLALMLRFSSISEKIITSSAVMIGLITLLTAGFIAGLKGKKRGLFLGLATGLAFTLTTFLIQFLGYDMLFSIEQVFYHLGYIIMAIIGSLMGVHLIQLQESKS